MDKVLAALSISPSALSIVAMVLEFACRMAQTEKPMGILHGLALVFRKLADLSDAILPQRIKQPASE